MINTPRKYKCKTRVISGLTYARLRAKTIVGSLLPLLVFLHPLFYSTIARTDRHPRGNTDVEDKRERNQIFDSKRRDPRKTSSTGTSPRPGPGTLLRGTPRVNAASVTGEDRKNTKDMGGIEGKQSIAMEERYTCKVERGVREEGRKDRRVEGGYCCNFRVRCSVGILMRGSLAQVVQEGGKASLCNHISLKM